MKEDKGNIDLNKIPKKDLYQAPEGYFDALPDKILQRIDEEENGKERKSDIQVNWLCRCGFNSAPDFCAYWVSGPKR